MHIPLSKNKFLNYNYYHLLLILALAVTYFVYLPSLSGPLFLDDLIYLKEGNPLDIKNFSLEEIKSAISYYPSRPISILSFSLNNIFDFNSPYNLKKTNLILHLATGVAIYIFLINLLRYIKSHDIHDNTTHDLLRFIPLIVTSLWLLHPLSISTVAYSIQRMAMLASFFSVLSMNFYLLAKIQIKNNKEKEPPLLYLIISVIFFICAVLSKEIGILTILYIALIEIYFGNQIHKLISRRKALTIYITVILIVLTLVANGYLIPVSYDSRNYSLYMRLLGEAATVLNYIQNILMPDISKMGVFLDDTPISNSLFVPITNLISVSIVFISILASVLFSNRFPLICFGILFFYTSHLIESTVLPLEIAFEHRNYLAILGLMVSCTSIAISLKFKPLTILPILILSAYILFFVYQTQERSKKWGSDGMFYSTQVLNHPGSFRANYYIAILLGNIGRKDIALKYYVQSINLNKSQIASESMMLIQDIDVSNNKLILENISKKLDRIIISNLVTNKLIELSDCILNKTCNTTADNLIGVLSSSQPRKFATPVIKNIYDILHIKLVIKGLNDCKYGLSLISELDQNNITPFIKTELEKNLAYCKKLKKK